MKNFFYAMAAVLLLLLTACGYGDKNTQPQNAGAESARKQAAPKESSGAFNPYQTQLNVMKKAQKLQKESQKRVSDMENQDKAMGL